jgi:hypothetical protein
MTTWHKGPPPSIGWWPASISRDRDAIRWWDGKFWSVPCYKGEKPWSIKLSAGIKASPLCAIEWTDRPASWPKRSRT